MLYTGYLFILVDFDELFMLFIVLLFLQHFWDRLCINIITKYVYIPLQP